jgi:release factor glutamine methyltransferase
MNPTALAIIAFRPVVLGSPGRIHVPWGGELDVSERRVDRVLRALQARLGDAAEAGMLLAHVLGKDRGWLFAHGESQIPDDAIPALEALVRRRLAGEPVAYLVGWRGFWRLDLAVGPDTLIPRPETELLVDLALERVAPGQDARVADLGTGSGAIALALALERPQARVLATDASAAALALARRNAEALGPGASRLEFRHGDWWEPVAGEYFDLVASNPPYIAEHDPHLACGDLRFEPRAALASGPDGLDAIRAIVHGAPAHLRPGGWLLLEHGRDQGAAVRALMVQAGLADVSTARDLEGRERVSCGRMATT